jgi:thioesterase domain-containing protein
MGANSIEPDRDALRRALEAEILAEIPLARAMGLSITGHDGDSVRLAAPLAPNINDKGCAFGGSLASLMTLAGWGLIVLRLRALERRCDVYVQDSSLRYLAPVWGELVTEARLADGESWDSLLPTLDARGRARLRVACRVAGADGADAVSFEARFVAFAAPAGA